MLILILNDHDFCIDLCCVLNLPVQCLKVSCIFRWVRCQWTRQKGHWKRCWRDVGWVTFFFWNNYIISSDIWNSKVWELGRGAGEDKVQFCQWRKHSKCSVLASIQLNKVICDLLWEWNTQSRQTEHWDQFSQHPSIQTIKALCFSFCTFS